MSPRENDAQHEHLRKQRNDTRSRLYNAQELARKAEQRLYDYEASLAPFQPGDIVQASMSSCWKPEQCRWEPAQVASVRPGTFLTNGRIEYVYEVRTQTKSGWHQTPREAYGGVRALVEAP